MRTDIYRHTITAPIRLNIMAFAHDALKPLKIVALSTAPAVGNSVVVVDSVLTPADMKLRLLEYYRHRLTLEDWTQIRAHLISASI